MQRAHFDIRRNDTVKVVSGRDAGKQGRVLRVFPGTGKVLVEHVMMVKKHVRPNPQRNIKGGIAEREAPLHVSNVLAVSSEDDKPTRLGSKVLPDGRKVRVACRGGATLD